MNYIYSFEGSSQSALGCWGFLSNNQRDNQLQDGTSAIDWELSLIWQNSKHISLALFQVFTLCWVSLPALLPPAPPSVTPACFSLLFQPGWAKSDPNHRLPAHFLPDAMLCCWVVTPPAPPALESGFSSVPNSTGAVSFLTHYPGTPHWQSDPLIVCFLFICLIIPLPADVNLIPTVLRWN